MASTFRFNAERASRTCLSGASSPDVEHALSGCLKSNCVVWADSLISSVVLLASNNLTSLLLVVEHTLDFRLQYLSLSEAADGDDAGTNVHFSLSCNLCHLSLCRWMLELSSRQMLEDLSSCFPCKHRSMHCKQT